MIWLLRFPKWLPSYYFSYIVAPRDLVNVFSCLVISDDDLRASHYLDEYWPIIDGIRPEKCEHPNGHKTQI